MFLYGAKYIVSSVGNTSSIPVPYTNDSELKDVILDDVTSEPDGSVEPS